MRRLVELLKEMQAKTGINAKIEMQLTQFGDLRVRVDYSTPENVWKDPEGRLNVFQTTIPQTDLDRGRFDVEEFFCLMVENDVIKTEQEVAGRG